MAARGKGKRTGNPTIDSVLDEMETRLDTVPTKVWTTLPNARQLGTNQKHIYHDTVNAKYYRIYRNGDDVLGTEITVLS